MTRKRNAPASGQLAKGALIKTCTTNDSTQPEELARLKSRFVEMGELYEQFNRAVMIQTASDQATEAVQKYMEEYDRAAQAMHDNRCRAAIRHLARLEALAGRLASLRHQIRLVQGASR